MRLLISVHDVMPDTREDVCGVLAWLAERQLGPVVLLVVPGAGGDADGIRWLRSLEAAGHELAGHGWRHAIDRYGGLFHRVHAALISRRAAEHLALTGDAAGALVERCHAWFAEAGLRAPRLYVPPAWAMGALDRTRLRDLPFAAYEDLVGFRTAGGARLPVPVVGFESDRSWTVPFLRTFNRVARGRAGRGGLLRVAIHPRDLRLPMAPDLAGLLDRYAAARPVPQSPQVLSGILAGRDAAAVAARAGQAAGAEGSAGLSLSVTAAASRGSMVKPRKP
jgi:hypothetical protein